MELLQFGRELDAGSPPFRVLDLSCPASLRGGGRLIVGTVRRIDVDGHPVDERDCLALRPGDVVVAW